LKVRVTRRRSKVVVADDSEPTRALAANALAGERVEVVGVASSEEVLGVLDAGVVLVITDLVLDGRAGLDLLRTLRHRRPALPVVCMSGDRELLAQASRAGADAVLEKPVSPDELRIVVRLLSAAEAFGSA
jgi:CheY-like chemotaxis protein